MRNTPVGFDGFSEGITVYVAKTNIKINRPACLEGAFRDDCWLPMIADSSAQNLKRDNIASCKLFQLTRRSILLGAPSSSAI